MNPKTQTNSSSKPVLNRKPPVKRGREDEPFQRMVMPKTVPKFNLKSMKI